MTGEKRHRELPDSLSLPDRRKTPDVFSRLPPPDCQSDPFARHDNEKQPDRNRKNKDSPHLLKPTPVKTECGSRFIQQQTIHRNPPPPGGQCNGCNMRNSDKRKENCRQPQLSVHAPGTQSGTQPDCCGKNHRCREYAYRQFSLPESGMPFAPPHPQSLHPRDRSQTLCSSIPSPTMNPALTLIQHPATVPEPPLHPHLPAPPLSDTTSQLPQNSAALPALPYT